MSAIFFSSTGGSLTKRARPLWPGTLMATMSPLRCVARQELLERLARQLVGVGVGLAEDLGVLDVVEGGGGRNAVDHLQPSALRRSGRGRCPRHLVSVACVENPQAAVDS